MTRPAHDLEKNLRNAARLTSVITTLYAELQGAAYAPVRRGDGTGGTGGIAKPTEQALCTCRESKTTGKWVTCANHKVRRGLDDVDRICAAIELEARRAAEILGRMGRLYDEARSDRPDPSEQQRRERDRIPKGELADLRAKRDQRERHIEAWGDESFSNARGTA